MSTGSEDVMVVPSGLGWELGRHLHYIWHLVTISNAILHVLCRDKKMLKSDKNKIKLKNLKIFTI